MSEKFKIGACALVFNETYIGAVIEGPILKIESAYREITCDQFFKQPVSRSTQRLKVSLLANIREVETGMDLLLDSDGRITCNMLGGDISSGGELLLIPFNKDDTTGYRLPNAVLLKETRYSFQEESEHSMSLEFEAFIDDNGILLEKIIVDDSQRINIQMTEINPAQIECALTMYIADKLGLVADKDIFRGGIPIGIDGCGVELTKEELSNSHGSRTIHAVVEYIDHNRDRVFGTIQKLAGLLPVYGETVTVDSEQVKFLSIMKSDTSFNRVSDNGQIKTSGCLDIVVKI